MANVNLELLRVVRKHHKQVLHTPRRTPEWPRVWWGVKLGHPSDILLWGVNSSVISKEANHGFDPHYFCKKKHWGLEFITKWEKNGANGSNKPSFGVSAQSLVDHVNTKSLCLYSCQQNAFIPSFWAGKRDHGTVFEIMTPRGLKFLLTNASFFEKAGFGKIKVWRVVVIIFQAK